jgi:histidine triad (HIT) family protein
MLSEEQITQIKEQLIQQIDSTFPEENKEQAKQEVLSMNSEQLEAFLEKNNMVQSNQGEQKCIFCSIISGEIPSTVIDENKDAIATLEINPISSGHILIIPKKHGSLEKIPKYLTTFSDKISKKINSKLKPKNILIEKTSLFGHDILNLIPVYKDETINSERKQASKEELAELQKTLVGKKKEIVKKQKVKKVDSKNLWLPRRIP